MKVLFKDQIKDRWLGAEVTGPVDGKFCATEPKEVVGKGAAVKIGFITLTRSVAQKKLPEDVVGFLIQYEVENTKKLYVETARDSLVTEKKKGKVAKTITEDIEPANAGSDASVEEAFEKKHWSKLNPFCLKCEKMCKQSSKVQVVQCAQYKKIK
jgi:hypothetical protein